MNPDDKILSPHFAICGLLFLVIYQIQIPQLSGKFSADQNLNPVFQSNFLFQSPKMSQC